MAKGLDTHIDLTRHLREVKQAKLDFVARYYRYPGSDKLAFSHSEALLLSALGLQLVACWEHTSDLSLLTRIRGARDAGLAFYQADLLRQPRSSCIYFCVDDDADDIVIKGHVIPYFHGVNECLKAAAGTEVPYGIGVYGSGLVCETLLNEGLATNSWLSNATGWNGYKDFKNWNIRQGKR